MVDRLGFRLVLMLTLAILPIGVIAVSQSFFTVDEARLRSEAALLGEVSRAVAVEQRLIQTAFGAASALGYAALPVIDDPDRCRSILSDFVASSPNYAFAGFIEITGMMRCSSTGSPIDFAGTDQFESALANPEPTVVLNRKGLVTGRTVLIVTQPIRIEGEVQGFLSISLLHFGLGDARLRKAEGRPLELISFNSAGAILTADGGVDGAEARLPAGIDLKDFISRPPRAFTARTRGGAARVFAVVPVVPGEVYSIGSWAPSDRLARPELGSLNVMAFPILMWLAGIIVAYFAVHRLVIGHLQRLRSAMRRFALGSRQFTPLGLDTAPKELREIGETFERMRLIITRDEADLENALRERDLLLREVHHRVKNNLQLIVSIINMQIRNARSREARSLLRRVQDRVLNLATIHRSLYQSSTLSALRVDMLIGEIVNQMLAMTSAPGSNIKVDSRLDPLTLDPDQAVSLSLAASEAVTNALKYIGDPAEGTQSWIRVRLEAPAGSDRVRLVIANSVGHRIDPPDGVGAGTGLGSQLIDAFAAQLDATIRRDAADGSYSLEIGFVREAEASSADYPAAAQ